jgi:hypothetical protein
VELFRIDPDYSGNYDSRRGGAVFHTSVPAVPPNTALTQEFNLFDDNDDRDQWPDDRPQDMALSGANDSGVYPGLDVNGDNVPDTDQNGNGLPDWEEAFLFYWSDPPEFIYDIDFNNNSLPDLTENDDRPDYPYDRDTKGRHAFLSWDRPLPYVELLRLGFYHAETISQGGESDVLYLRYHLGYDVGERGHVKLRGDWKQVEDDIDNPVFLWLTTGNPRDNSLVLQDTEPDPITGAAPGFGLEGLRLTDADPMLMRNSTVNTVNLVADLTPLDRLTWHSSYKCCATGSMTRSCPKARCRRRRPSAV